MAVNNVIICINNVINNINNINNVNNNAIMAAMAASAVKCGYCGGEIMAMMRRDAAQCQLANDGMAVAYRL